MKSVGVALAFAIFGGAIRHDADDAKYLELASQSKYDAASLVVVDGTPRASAVMISPTFALTAAHVLDDRKPSQLQLEVNGKRIAVAEFIIHPRYRPSDLAKHPNTLMRKGIDLALIRLSEPANVVPAKLYEGNQEIGKIGTLVGFGVSGDAFTVITNPTRVGTRRAGQNMIDQIEGEVDGRQMPPGYLLSDFDHPTKPQLNRIGSAHPLALEYCGVGGDSGSPVFIEVDGRTLVAGIYATGTFSVGEGDDVNGLYGATSYAVRISEQVGWIRSHVK